MEQEEKLKKLNAKQTKTSNKQSKENYVQEDKFQEKLRLEKYRSEIKNKLYDIVKVFERQYENKFKEKPDLMIVKIETYLQDARAEVKANGVSDPIKMIKNITPDDKDKDNHKREKKEMPKEGRKPQTDFNKKLMYKSLLNKDEAKNKKKHELKDNAEEEDLKLFLDAEDK